METTQMKSCKVISCHDSIYKLDGKVICGHQRVKVMEMLIKKDRTRDSDPLTRSEIVAVTKRIDEGFAHWMGKRKNISQDALEPMVLTLTLLDKLARQAPELKLPDRAPNFAASNSKVIMRS